MADLDGISPWKDPKTNYHNTRVLCDLSQLSFNRNIPVYGRNGNLLGHFSQKDIICACIYQESRFQTNPKPCENKLKDGTVWSRDWGIVQVNDYFNIGPGKPFPSVDYVIQNPQAGVQFMIDTMKRTGQLRPWSSYTGNTYKQWLLPDSPMWSLTR